MKLLSAGGNLGFTFLHDIQKLQNGEFYLFGLLCCAGYLKGCAVAQDTFYPRLWRTSTKQFSIKEIPDLDI